MKTQSPSLRLRTALAVLLGLVVGSSTNTMAQVVTPVSATASSFYSAGQNPVNLINGSGLLGNGPILTETHDNNGGAGTMWHSDGSAVAGTWVTFDLGTQFTLTAADIWQMNQPCCLGRGVKTFGIYTSPTTNSADLTNYVGSFSLAEGSGTTNEARQYLPFSASGVRLVMFAITNDWNDAVNDYVGLSEVRFEGRAPPAIVTQPRSTTGFQGDFVTTFTVTAVGAPTPTYRWYKDSTNLLTGATNLTLTLTNLQVADSGNYSLTASNSLGSATSSNALLTVLNPPIDTTNNLLTHLKFDETTGLTAADSTTNGNNGALQGFPGDDTQWVAQGRINGAIHFLPASSGYQTVVLVPDPVGMFDFSTSLTFTLSAWFRGSSAQVDGAGIICKGFGAGGEQYCFDVYLGNFRFYCRDAAGTNVTTLNTPSQLNNTWQHVVVVFNQPFNRLKFYLNGTEVASTTPPASLYSNTHDVSIGSRELSITGSGGYNLPLVSDIDDVRIYDRSLSPADVLVLYNENPLPVSFVQPPQSANLFVGDTLRLTAAVEGTRPITWQWLKNGTNLAGAANNNLTITNVQTSDAGSYRLVAANAANTVTSAVATVTVTAVTSVTNGLAGYWRFDETHGTTAADSSGLGNNGTTMNVAGDDSQWVAGRIGGAMKFSGPTALSEYVIVPTWPKAVNGTMTFSAWVWADARPDQARIACGGSGWDGIGQFLFSQSTGTSDLRGYVETSGSAQVSAQEGVLFPTNGWQHVAMVADGTTLRIYRNGVQVATNAYDGTLFNPTNALSLGARLDATDSAVESGAWEGKMDDMAYWTRGLSGAEVFALYAAGVNGLPVTQADAYNKILPPLIAQSPASATVLAGDKVTLSVQAASLSPLTYQWRQGSLPVPNATNASLTFAWITPGDAGDYTVVVSNSSGSVTSAPPAVLTVNNPAVDLAGGLVMHLKLDETSGFTATDATTNANNGVLLNFLDPVPTNWVAGVLSGALLFNSGAGADNQAVVMNDSDSLDFSTTAAFSLSAWVKGPPQGAAGGSAGIIAKGFGGGGEAFCVDISGSTYRFFVRDASAVVISLYSAFAPKNNTWQLLVATHDAAGGRMKLYVDGVEAASGTPAASILATAGNPVNIGCRQAAGGEYNYPFLGVTDDVRIYNRALTPMEQRALYEAVVPPNVSLTVTRSGGDWVISWPAAVSGFTLEAAPVLPAATWTNVPGVVNNSMTITPMGGSLFYRLRR